MHPQHPPKPHAKVSSSESCARTPSSPATAAVARSIGEGPQARIKPGSCLLSASSSRDVSAPARAAVVGGQLDLASFVGKALRFDEQVSRARPVVEPYALAVANQALRRQQDRRDADATGDDRYVGRRVVEKETVAERTGHGQLVART